MELKYFRISSTNDLNKCKLIKVKVERSTDGVIEKLIFSKKQFKKFFPGVNYVPTKYST